MEPSAYCQLVGCPLATSRAGRAVCTPELLPRAGDGGDIRSAPEPPARTHTLRLAVPAQGEVSGLAVVSIPHPRGAEWPEPHSVTDEREAHTVKETVRETQW